MTTTQTPNPGAVIDIRLSEAALNHQNSAKDLGSALSALFETQRIAFNADGIFGKITTGGTLGIALAAGQTIRFTGTKAEDFGPAPDGSKIGFLSATSVSVTDPKAFSAVSKGGMTAIYGIDGDQIFLRLLDSKIGSYQLDATDPALGKTSTSYAGAVDINTIYGPSSQETVNFLTGDLTSVSTRGAALLKSEVLKGKLSVQASYEYSPPTEPITTEVPAAYVLRTSLTESSSNSYDANYYDGSYVRLKSASGVTVDGSMTMPKLLSNAARWSGDDDLRIDLPQHMQDPWNINTGDGNDKIAIKGGGGELTIDAGSGDDLITLLDETRNAINGGDGIDTLKGALASIDLWRYSDIENFVFTGRTAANVQGNLLNNDLSGGAQRDTLHGDSGEDVLRGLAGNDELFGDDGNDQLFGNAGNDLLDGGTGGDHMWGGAGNDTYIVDSYDDRVNEARSATNAADSGGKDTVKSSVSFDLGAYLDNLELTGERSIVGIGNALANIITGNDSQNTLSGEAGNDILFGNGGDDTLSGGAGNDSLDGGAGDDDLVGGAGNDILRGGAGNDTYYVDSQGDRIDESASATDKSDAGGIDTVLSSITYALSDNLENLTLDGIASINGTGNATDNSILGSSGDNLINGKGGADRMDGRDGSDIYLIGSAGEHSQAEISDTGSSGTDEIRFSPAAPATPGNGAAPIVPRLILFSDDTGVERVVIGAGNGKVANTSGKIAADVDASAVQNQLTLIGNNGSNQLIGTAFDDTLAGNGGNDVLTGGLGADKFVFSMAPNAKTEVETITDFASGTDQLLFVRSKFAGIGSGDTLQDSAFHADAGASKGHDADDRFVFDTTSGHLYFDRDGSGSAAAVLIGVLNPGASLAASDFKMVDAF